MILAILRLFLVLIFALSKHRKTYHLTRKISKNSFVKIKSNLINYPNSSRSSNGSSGNYLAGRVNDLRGWIPTSSSSN